MSPDTDPAPFMTYAAVHGCIWSHGALATPPVGTTNRVVTAAAGAAPNNATATMSPGTAVRSLIASHGLTGVAGKQRRSAETMLRISGVDYRPGE
jgi:hypothetical protein